MILTWITVYLKYDMILGGLILIVIVVVINKIQVGCGVLVHVRIKALQTSIRLE